jgi:hypothetical protein
VLDDVIDQTEKTIDEIVPGAWLVMQTTFDQFPIPGYQSHGGPPSSRSGLVGVVWGILSDFPSWRKGRLGFFMPDSSVQPVHSASSERTMIGCWHIVYS